MFRKIGHINIIISRKQLSPLIFFIYLRIIGYLIAIRYIPLPFARSYRVVPDIISLCQSKSYSISFSVTTALLSNKHIQKKTFADITIVGYLFIYFQIYILYILHTIAITRVVHFCRRPVR